MSRAASRLRRSLLSVAAEVTYRSGLLRGLRSAANRWEATASRNGSGGLRYLRRRKKGNLQVLVYHRVTAEPDEFLPSLPVEAFVRQMSYLARNTRVLPLSEAVRAIGQDAVPDDALSITFDDGYRDNFDHAYPVLRRLGLPATVFLSTGVIGTDDILWHDRVFRAFKLSRRPEYHGFDLTRDAHRDAARSSILTELKKLDRVTRLERIRRLLEELDVREPRATKRLMLDWDEVREMARGGMAFGAHTVSHSILSRLPIDEARNEIAQSKLAIESRLQTEVDAFAYPNGRTEDYNEAVKQLLRDSGFASAVTTRFGTNSLGAAHGWDPMEIRRGGPSDAETPIFAAKLTLYKLTT